MGRSNPDHVLRSELGARFTTILSLGTWNPADLIAARTRSRDSWMAVSGIPTIENEGIPLEMSTSTSTGSASTPRSTALFTL